MAKARLELVQGDITNQPDVEAVVNAANAELAPGGGVAGAIHQAAGPELYLEARKLAPIHPGQCVITKAYDLPNRFVAHCLGPRYGIDKPEAELLAGCYSAATESADERGITSIAFPAISTGAFGYPLEEAARVALETINKCLEETEHVKLVRFVLFSIQDLEAFEAIQDQLSLEQ